MKNILPFIYLILMYPDVGHAQNVATPNPAERQIGSIECGSLATIDKYVRAYQSMAAFDGVVLIAEGDRIVYLCSYGLADYRFESPLEPDARFRIASLSKQFTMAGIGLLAHSKYVSLDTSLSGLLPDFPNADRITLRHLLDHTSGIPHTNRLEWMDMGIPMSLDEIVDRLSEEPLLFEPGTDRAYSNGGYALLAAVIENASGQSFGEYVESTFSIGGYPSVGHEEPSAVVENMAHRYAPGPVYGVRVEAPTYVTANRIGGGSLFSNAEDVWRFFRASYGGAVVGEALTEELFPRPEDGDVRLTGRSPGALAQVYMNFESGLSVVTLSSNSGWPGSFIADIVDLYEGKAVDLTSFEVVGGLDDDDASIQTGSFLAGRFGWNVQVSATEAGLVFQQGNVRTAFAQTASGALHLPIYDWLCDYEADGSGFTCRQRDPDAEIRFVFDRIE